MVGDNSKKGEKRMKTLLPLGSIITVPFETIKFMIIGRSMINHEDEKAYDYIAIPWPIGFDGETMLFLNDLVIEKVVHVGYSDSEELEQMMKEEDILKEIRNGEIS